MTPSSDAINKRGDKSNDSANHLMRANDPKRKYIVAKRWSAPWKLLEAT